MTFNWNSEHSVYLECDQKQCAVFYKVWTFNCKIKCIIDFLWFCSWVSSAFLIWNNPLVLQESLHPCLGNTALLVQLKAKVKKVATPPLFLSKVWTLENTSSTVAEAEEDYILFALIFTVRATHWMFIHQLIPVQRFLIHHCSKQQCPHAWRQLLSSLCQRLHSIVQWFQQ